MIRHKFSFYEPHNLFDAYNLLNDVKNSKIFAGGTDIVPMLKDGLIFPNSLISLNKIDELKYINITSENLEIGSMVLLSDLTEFSKKHLEYSAFINSAGKVASPQIRNTGTIGGNIFQAKRCYYYNQSEEWRSGIEMCYMTGGNLCHQMPAKNTCCAIYYSDMAPLLISANAKIKVFFNGLTETYFFEDIFTDEKIMHKVNNGIAIGFEIPIYDWHKRKLIFKKYSVRGAIDFPLSNAAISARDEYGKINVRLTVGAMGPRPYRLLDTERKIEMYLENSIEIDDEIYDLAIKEARKNARPIKETTISPIVKINSLSVIKEVINQLRK